jgi:hypothetical protein
MSLTITFFASCKEEQMTQIFSLLTWVRDGPWFWSDSHDAISRVREEYISEMLLRIQTDASRGSVISRAA